MYLKDSTSRTVFAILVYQICSTVPRGHHVTETARSLSRVSYRKPQACGAGTETLAVQVVCSVSDSDHTEYWKWWKSSKSYYRKFPRCSNRVAVLTKVSPSWVSLRFCPSKDTSKLSRNTSQIQEKTMPLENKYKKGKQKLSPLFYEV